MMKCEQHNGSVSNAPTLFLNYGGVLNVGHDTVDESGIVTLDSDRALLEFAPYLIDILAPRPQIRIIVTTSWLQTLGAETTIALRPEQLRRRVFGTTLSTPPRLGEIKDGTAKTMLLIRHALKHGLLTWLALDNGGGAYLQNSSSIFAHRFGISTRLAERSQTATRVARKRL
jgi:hypothetical protein